MLHCSMMEPPDGRSYRQQRMDSHADHTPDTPAPASETLVMRYAGPSLGHDIDRRRVVRLRAAFAREGEASGRLLAIVRAVAALVVAAWLAISRLQLDVIYYLAPLAVFAIGPLG